MSDARGLMRAGVRGGVWRRARGRWRFRDGESRAQGGVARGRARIGSFLAPILFCFFGFSFEKKSRETRERRQSYAKIPKQEDKQNQANEQIVVKANAFLLLAFVLCFSYLFEQCVILILYL